MGAAQSSNVAEAVTNVSNYVSNSTTANTTQADQVKQAIIFDNCTLRIKGNMSAEESANLAQSNTQIISSLNNTSLNNNIQQQMLQQATSKVGTMGVGYASASNSASEFVNDTNQVVNAMSAGANQYGSKDQSFTCVRSDIEVDGNFDINFSSNSDFLSTQTLRQQNTADIVNDVSQSITQKASATVEGIGALLMIIAIIIGIIIYGATRVVDSGPVKIAVGIIAMILIAVLSAGMYIRGTPPFFNSDNECVNGSSMGGCEAECVNMTTRTLYLDHPPLKYNYSVTTGGTSETKGNLVQMFISSVASAGSIDGTSGNNGGYTADIYNTIGSIINNVDQDIIKYAHDNGITWPIPNPLYLPKPNPNPTKQGDLYNEIPDQFIQIPTGQQKSGSAEGVCTPGILCVSDDGSGQDNMDTCPVQNCINNTVLNTTSQPKMGIANFNEDAWNAYVNANTKQANFARFLLAKFLNIQNNIYVSNDELVIDSDGSVKVASEATGAYKFVPSQSQTLGNNGLKGPGTLTGPVGYCNDNTYKFHGFMRKIGSKILLALFIIGAGIMGYTWLKNRNPPVPSK